MERTSQFPPISNFKCPTAKSKKLETQKGIRYLFNVKSTIILGVTLVTEQLVWITSVPYVLLCPVERTAPYRITQIMGRTHCFCPGFSKFPTEVARYVSQSLLTQARYGCCATFHCCCLFHAGTIFVRVNKMHSCLACVRNFHSERCMLSQ